VELIVIYLFSAVALGISFYKDRGKTKKAFSIALKVLQKMAPSLLAIIGLVGLVVGLVPPELIEQYLGEGAGIWGTLMAATAGAIAFIPSLVSLPMAGSLLRSGASAMTVAAFITTLTMVGAVTAPLEIKEFGQKFTIMRNSLSFVFALIISFLIGVFIT
jgi:uncharacterized membrane protein YraQ (UPF0718 family)